MRRPSLAFRSLLLTLSVLLAIAACTGGTSTRITVPRTNSSTGRIACAASSCDARVEECCRKDSYDPGRCVAIGTPCTDGEQRLACDDLTDCKAGLTCCEFWACSGGCPMEHQCMAAPCPNGSQVCARGAACPEGLSCHLGKGALGTCHAPPPSIPCGTSTCTGGRGCCWDVKKKTGSCTDECVVEDDDEGNPTRERLHCMSTESCGGETCAKIRGLGGFGCMGPAIAGDTAMDILCASVKDCARRNMAGPPTGCVPSPDLPPTVKVCEYGPWSEPP